MESMGTWHQSQALEPQSHIAQHVRTHGEDKEG